MNEAVIQFRRVWAMPNRYTFDIPPIAQFVRGYLAKSKVSVDPFSGNKRWATYTNDLNPETPAEYHRDAEEFLVRLRHDGLQADLVIFDPPYSPGQVVECYKAASVERADAGQNGALYRRVRDAVAGVLVAGGIVLSFGWNSAGMGIDRGFEIIDGLLVCHGGAHNDTICMAERRKPTIQDKTLFEA